MSTFNSANDFGLQRNRVHPVLELINKCDQLAKNFDSTFEQSVSLLSSVQQGNSSIDLDTTLMMLRETLQKCEEIVSLMLNCIYQDIPLLLDQMDAAEPTASSTGGLPGNFNPKSALDSISQLFYSYQELLLEKRELLADFTCEEITPQEFIHSWSNIDNSNAVQDSSSATTTTTTSSLHKERRKQVDDLADLLAGF